MDTARMVRIGLGGLAVAGLVSGCKSVSKADYEAAIRENTELRERVAALQSTVADANAQIDSCESERQALAAQVSGMQPVASAPSRASGFENIPGVSVGRTGDAISVAVAGDVLFASGSATLKNSAKASLDRVASVLQSQYGSNAIRVEGYTDTDPIRRSQWRTNERLSAERALAVEEYLVSRGVDRHRIYAAAFGDASQRGSKEQSRRVEIVVLAGQY